MKPLTILVLLAGVFSAASCSSNSSASDNVVARVNGIDITSAELEREFQGRIAGVEQMPSPEEVQNLKLQLLNEMINDHILLELAANASLTASDAEVDVRFNEFKSQYTEERFQELLSQQGMTVDEVKAEMRRSLSMEKLVNKEITSKISVSESEIQNFYEQNKESFNLPEMYRIAHILVTPFPDPEVVNLSGDDAETPEAALQKAQRLLREIQGGADFALLAREYSEDPGSSQLGGDFSFQPLQVFEGIDPRLAQIIQRMRTGETHPQIVETQYGYHIVRLIEKDAGGQKDLSDPRVQAEVRQVIFNRKDQMLKAAFSETVRNNAQISNFLAQRILDSAGTAR